ncbi:MAG: SpoIIE family protein phosphatase [Magnetococcales bacterium]|nr:SpoIIE family protein phosphatase [Magnetococcales bacterium]
MTCRGGEEKTLILVADDDEFMRAVINQYLTNAGHEVLMAADGAVAVELFRHNHPDLVLLDADMPVTDGFSACTQIRQIAGDRDVPVIMVTALDDDASVARAFAAGAMEYVNKPIKWSVLKQRIRLLVQQRKTLETLRERERQIRLFMHKTPVSIAMFDREMRYLQVSHRWLDEFGLVNRPILNLCHYDICPEESQHWRNIHKRCLDGAWERREADPITDSQGHVSWYRWEAFPWQKNDGEIGGIMMFTENITRQKELENEIRQHQLRLTMERDLVEEIITRMRRSEEFDARYLRFLQSPVENTTGDLLLSAFRPDGAQHLLLGDFTGHGLPAAIGGPMVADIFYSMTRKNLPLLDIVNETNLRLCQKTPADMFMAAGFLEIAPDRRGMTVWNCTIPDMLVFRRGRLIHRSVSTHFARGMIHHPVTSGTFLEVEPGDRIFAYTDGFIEERDREEQMFGQKRFETLLQRMIQGNEPLETLRETLRSYRAGPCQSDDMTLVEVTV